MGIHGNPKLDGVAFDVLGNALKMPVRFKIIVEQCSKYAGSEFKDNPAGAAAAIQTRTKSTTPKPKQPKSGASKVNVIIWKEKYLGFKQKERIRAQTNPRIFNIVLGKYTQETKLKLEGREGWPKIREDQDGVALLKAVHRLCN